MGNFRVNKRIFLIIAMLTLMLAGIASFTSSYNSTEALSFCDQVGSNMASQKVSSKSKASPEASNRKWTVEELFKGSIEYSSFYGEGPGTWYYAGKENRGESREDIGWTDETQTTFESSRSFLCAAGNADWVNQGFINTANGLTLLTSSTIMTLIGKDVMAETLTTIIGGDGGSDGGLIGTFLNSFYMPLVVIAVIIMTITLIYKGLIQRQMREALSSIIWTFGAFIVGLMLMLQPQLLASAPQKATSTITSCVLGALSGQNCMTSEVTAPTMLAGRECISNVGGSGGEDSETVVNSLNCTIWKTFVLEPWAEEQFGAPYNELYTDQIPDGGELWSNLPEGTGAKYCVNLSSQLSLNDSIKNGIPVMDGAEGTVCNVALYHLFIKTKMKDLTNQDGNNYNSTDVMITDDSGKYDSRWYDIAVPMAGDVSKWDNWAGNSKFFSRMGSGIMGLIAVAASTTVLMTLAIFGGAYKIVGLILMAFAPVFFLFAIEPTRGKKIFLGWLETLVSSVLKYFAITVLIVIALVMYAGLLSNTTGINSLVGTIVLTVALHMYRKEIVDLIGASNMGGQRLSNKANEVGGRVGKFTKEKSSAAIGGAVGGALGSSKARNERVKSRTKTVEDLQTKINAATTEEEKEFFESEQKLEQAELDKEGGKVLGKVKALRTGSKEGRKASVSRSFKRGTGLTANAFQQSGRTKDDLDLIAKKEKEEGVARRAKFEDQLQTRRAEAITPIPVVSNTDNEKGETFDVVKTDNEVKRDVTIGEIRDSQRDKVEYKGDLSKEEIEELNNFADNITKNSSDEDLAIAGDNPAVLNDPNKRNIVANEINARIKTNSMIGISSDALSRTELADNTNVSREELKFNLEMHKENYLETGNENELKKYLQAGNDFTASHGGEFNSDNAEKILKEFKAKVGDDYVRKEGVPTEAELKGKEEYKVDVQGDKMDSTKITTPNKLSAEAEEHKTKIDEVAGIKKDILEDKDKKARAEKAKRKNTLPDIDEVDNSVKDKDEKGPENDDTNRKETKRDDTDRKDPEVEDTKRDDTDRKETKRDDTDRKDPEVEDIKRDDTDRKEPNKSDRNEESKGAESEPTGPQQRNSEPDKVDTQDNDTERKDSTQVVPDSKETKSENIDRKEPKRENIDRKEPKREDTDRKEPKREDTDRKESKREDTDRKEPKREDTDRKESKREDTDRREPPREDMDVTKRHRPEADNRFDPQERDERVEDSYDNLSNEFDDDFNNELNRAQDELDRPQDELDNDSALLNDIFDDDDDKR